MKNKKSFWFISFSLFGISSWVDTWRFSKSAWSRDRQFTWKSSWSPFTLTHNPTSELCETGDASFCEYKLIAWYMSHVTWWLWSIQLKSHLAKIGGHCPSEGRDKTFFMNIRWSHDQWVTWVGGWDSLILNPKAYSKKNRTQ